MCILYWYSIPRLLAFHITAPNITDLTFAHQLHDSIDPLLVWLCCVDIRTHAIIILSLQVRAMWRSLEGFYDKSSHQREVVSSVLHGQVDEHAIDGKDIVFQVCMCMLFAIKSVQK
jgi:hypothetical protein